MIWRATESSQSAQAMTTKINVTGLTRRQKRRIFINCFGKAGFAGFDKKKVGDQIYYIFTYKN
jgi:hypothetical protein